MRALVAVEGQCHDSRQICLQKCENRRGCLSITVYAKVETQVSSCLKTAILILAFPWIRDCSWRPTSLKVGLPLALGDCDAPALKPRSSPGDFTSAHHWPTRRAQT